MYAVVLRKLDRLRQPGFTKFSQNWLAIYDNLDFSNLNNRRAVFHLQMSLRGVWSASPGFNTLFIETHGEIAGICSGGAALFPVTDLWTSRAA
jgi:hypothetical protein